MGFRVLECSAQPGFILFYFIFIFLFVVSRHAGLGWLPYGVPSIPPQALGGSVGSVGCSMHSLCQAVFLGVRVVIIRTGLYEYAWGEGRGVGPRRMQTGSHDSGISWDAQIVLGVADCLWDGLGRGLLRLKGSRRRGDEETSGVNDLPPVCPPTSQQLVW